MTLTHITIFLTGLVLGSFYNVVIYRLPRGESIITPPSHCPACGTKLKAIDMIPVLSYLLYRGRCRYCGNSISWQYPVVELLTGVLFLLTYLKFGLFADFFIHLFLISNLIIISFIDLNEKIIPNILTYSGIVVGLIFSLIFNHISLTSAFMGLIIPAVSLLIIALIFKGGMGMGDVKLVGLIGTFIGWKYTLLAIFLGALTGSIIGVYLLVTGSIERKTRLPFGPFINLGTVTMILWGEKLITLYWQFFR